MWGEVEIVEKVSCVYRLNTERLDLNEKCILGVGKSFWKVCLNFLGQKLYLLIKFINIGTI